MKKLLFGILLFLLVVIGVAVIPFTKTISFDAYLVTNEGIRSTVPVKATYVINKLDVIKNYRVEKALKAANIYDSTILSDYTEICIEDYINSKLSLFSSRITSYNLYLNQDTLITAFTLDVPVKSPNRITKIVLGNIKFDNWFLETINKNDSLRNAIKVLEFKTDSLRFDVEKRKKDLLLGLDGKLPEIINVKAIKMWANK